MRKLSIVGLLVTCYLLLVALVHAQNFNVASTYPINDDQALSGDIVISAGEKGILRGDVSYDSRLFGVIVDKPILVLKEATSSARPVIRQGDTLVNITDFNGQIKKGDLITSSPILGKGMRAGQSGYVLGIALDDANLSNQTITFQNKQYKLGTVKLAIRIEYAEITTTRNALRLFSQLNAAIFRNVQDPEKFTQVIRLIFAGIIAVIAFILGFFTISRSLMKATEAIGRNPLAKKEIFLSVIFQLVITAIGTVATIIIVLILVRF